MMLFTVKIAKKAFLTVNNFFLCVLKNTDQKNICASIVFKADQSQSTKKTIFWGDFLQKPITHFLRGPKWYF